MSLYFCWLVESYSSIISVKNLMYTKLLWLNCYRYITTEKSQTNYILFISSHAHNSLSFVLLHISLSRPPINIFLLFFYRKCQSCLHHLWGVTIPCKCTPLQLTICPSSIWTLLFSFFSACNTQQNTIERSQITSLWPDLRFCT